MISSNPRVLPRFVSASLWGVSFLISLLYMIHFQNTNNDFQVFMKAGEYFLARENPWSKFTDPNAMYLNGAGTLILSSLLSLVPIEYGLMMLRVSNILAILAISFLIGRKSPQLPVPAIFISILLIFPFRSAMEYGQYTIVYSVVSFILLRNVLDKKSDSSFGIISLALVVDFKPHIIVGLLVLILLHKRFMLIMKAVAVWLVIQLIVGSWSNTIPTYEWFLAIKFRSDFVSQGEDNLSLVSHFGSAHYLAAMILSALMLFYLRGQIKASGRCDHLVLEIVAVSLILSPLLHPTDILFVALVLLSRFNFSRLEVFLFGLFLVWSPLLSGAIFTFTVTMLLFFLLSLVRNAVRPISYLTVIAPYLLYLLSVRLKVDEVFVRHFLQQLILIIIAVRFIQSNQRLLALK